MNKTAGWEVKALLFLAIMWTVAVAQNFLLPIILAFILYLLSNPIFTLLLRLKIPRIIAALLIVSSLMSIVTFGISSLITPAYNWIDSAPQHLHTIEKKFSLDRSLVKINKVKESIQDIGGETPNQIKVKIVPDTGTIGLSLFDLTSGVIVLFFSTFGFLLFYLIYFKSFILNMEKILFNYKRIHSENLFLTNLQIQVSRYMFIFTLICVGLGLTMTTALWLINFPNPLLWGVMIMFLTFIPYLGHLTGILVIFLISLVSFDNYWQIFLPSGLYILFSTLEGQVVTPMLLGAKLDLNPLVVLINMFFWGWIWGISGFLISIPLLVSFKTILKYIPDGQKYKSILEK